MIEAGAKWATALHQAQSAIEAVKKDKAGFSGKYASTETMIVEARGVLSRAGLTVCCVKSTVEPRGTFTRLAKGEDATSEDGWIQTSVFAVVHQSGEGVQMSIEIPVYVEKGRPIDKSTAAAKTYSLGYFLRDLLLIPRIGADEEVDLRQDADFDPGMKSASEMKETFERLMRTVTGAKEMYSEIPSNRPALENAIALLEAQDARNNLGRSIGHWLTRAGASTAEDKTKLLASLNLPSFEAMRSMPFAELEAVEKTLRERMGGR